MVNDGNIEKQGMSTKKKWLIGCGGCLGVVVLVAAGMAVLAGLGFNALKDVSNQSVQNMFGKSFKAEPYMAMGLPLEQKNLKNMVMLIDQHRGLTIFAVDAQMTDAEANVLKSGDANEIEAYLKRLSAQASSSSNSSARMQDVRFDGTSSVKLANGKTFSITRATVEATRRGTTAYSPAVAALIPEAGDRLVALIALDPNNGSTNPDADFSHEQDELQREIIRIINDSELDDRLTSTQTVKQTAAP